MENDQGYIDGGSPPPHASRYHFPSQNHKVASSSLSLVTLEEANHGRKSTGPPEYL